MIATTPLKSVKYICVLQSDTKGEDDEVSENNN